MENLRRGKQSPHESGTSEAETVIANRFAHMSLDRQKRLTYRLLSANQHLLQEAIRQKIELPDNPQELLLQIQSILQKEIPQERISPESICDLLSSRRYLLDLLRSQKNFTSSPEL